MKNLARLLGLSSAPLEIVVQAKNQIIVEKAMDNIHNIETVIHSDDAENVSHVNVDDITPNPFQPRKIFNHDSLQDLMASIQEYGVIQRFSACR